MQWSKAQEFVRKGDADVIDALVQTEARARLFEFSRAPATMEARVYFHRTISGIHDAESMRGFTVAAKEGSACAEWPSAQRSSACSGQRSRQPSRASSSNSEMPAAIPSPFNGLPASGWGPTAGERLSR